MKRRDFLKTASTAPVLLLGSTTLANTATPPPNVVDGPPTMKVAEGLCKFRVPILQVDALNLNNRIYPRKAIEKAIESLDEVGGQVGMSSSSTLKLSQLSHICRDFKIEEQHGQTWLTAEVQVLETPEGKTLQDLLRSKEEYCFRTCGVGKVKVKSGWVNSALLPRSTICVISNGYRLVSINLIPKKDSA